MSLFNNIEKIKYTGASDNELISLIEYILFADERKKSKYIVFKFKNNITQILFDIKVEVLQYTDKDQLIERSYLEYTSEGIKPLEEFVPKFKFLANPRTKYISVVLKYAKFEKIIFEEGKTIDNPLKFSDYVQENAPKASVKQVKKQVKKDKKERAKEAKRAKNKRNARKATVKNLKNNKLNKVALTITSCLSLALVGFGVYASINHCLTTNEYTFGEFDIRADRERGVCTIIEYNGNSDQGVIPELIGGYKPIALASDTFANNDVITSIVIETEYFEIKPFAIRDCNSLQYVTINSLDGYVSSNAVYNCSNLDSFSFRNGVFSRNSIVESNNLISFSFKYTNVNYIGDVFGVSNEELQVQAIYDYSNYQKIDFYKNLPSYVTVYYRG